MSTTIPATLSTTQPEPIPRCPAAPRRGKRHRRGAAVVEFAVVAPIFFLLIFGIIEFGRLIMVQQIITNASREGARWIVVDGATVSDVTSKVNTYLTGAGLPAASATVTFTDTNNVNVDPSTVANGSPIKATVSIPFSRVSWVTSPYPFISTLIGTQVSSSTVMLRETVQ